MLCSLDFLCEKKDNFTVADDSDGIMMDSPYERETTSCQRYSFYAVSVRDICIMVVGERGIIFLTEKKKDPCK